MARKRKKKKKQQGEAEAGFGTEAAAPAAVGHERLTPVEIQQKVFRLAFRGYNERDVDEFLDRITEDLAAIHEENKRLREQIAEGGGTPGGLEDAQQQAESIVRQAREHAARLVGDAEARAAAVGTSAVGAVAGGLPGSFLLQERAFLQQMAALIQDHARRLKDEARRARATVADAPAMAADERAPEPAPQEEAPPSPAFGAAPVVLPDVPEPGSPSPEPPSAASQAPAPEEATAPWGPAEPGAVEPTPAGPGPVETPDADPGDDQDPLLSAWENAFTGESGAGRPGEEPALYPSEVRGGKDDDEDEPSLRELFWGDEG